MDRKNSSILVLLLALTIVGGVLASFGIPFLSEGRPKISLPDISQSEGTPDSSQGSGANAGYLSVEVTRTTVQNVIASLRRPESYYRELTLELFWQMEDAIQSSLTKVEVWTDGGSTMTTAMPDTGLIQHSIVHDGMRYVWYENDQRFQEFPAEEGEVDLAQRVLTYEDVLKLPIEYILDAGYEEKNGKYCIWVECAEDNVGYLERYWIEVESGLLVAAETKNREDGRITQRMTETLCKTPIPQPVKFTLPNGQVLYQTQAALETQEEDEP